MSAHQDRQHGQGKPGPSPPQRIGHLKRVLSVLLAILWLAAPGAAAADPRPYGIALIGDPHLPGNALRAKEQVIRTISGWKGIDRVVVLGDICKGTGTAAEYAFAKEFFRRIPQPLRVVAGNHDFLYEDEPDGEGRKVKAPATVRRQKLARFVETFGLAAASSAERLGGYLLVYLSPDDLESGLLVKLSDERLAWLARTLADHAALPTIVFFHAPLAGTLTPYNERVNTPSFIAQPRDRLAELLQQNPQVFLWAAGHLHVPATKPDFHSPVNVYDGRVTVVHNTDLERKHTWTNVLYLSPDKVLVRTYDHRHGAWLPDRERVIRPPLRRGP